ncbi:MAG: UbiA family prenyltransferase, partial [Tepidiformaceae bacterium]
MTANALPLPRATLLDTLRGYVALTKPGIIVLLLITTVPAMVVADRAWPSNWLVLATLIGGTLSAAGANTINCWYDRDIDAIMKRTQSRPLVTGLIRPTNALAFGIGLG